MIARGASLLWLLLVWLALWESISIANVLSGLALGVLLVVLFPVRSASARTGRFRPLRAVQLLGYFLWKLVEANVVVAWEVITPGNAGVNEGVVAVPLTGASDVVVAAVANMISLTPGTLTIEIERGPTVLYVHVLHLRSIEHVRSEVFHLELRVLRAFGTEDATALAERRLVDARGSLQPGDAT